MKRISFLVPILVALISFSSCKKDKAEPSFVDDYNAPLTEAKGTEHSGDYFPLDEGYSWNYSGKEEVVGESTISGGGYNETEPINESYTIRANLDVETMESITLKSGTYDLYPLRESPSSSGYDYRYFEKASDAVYFRALQVEGGEIIEVENPMFIKNPLVVGDSWETQPSVNMDTEMEGEDLGFSFGETSSSIKCKIYVIGEESVNWNGESALPVRLDERVEANFKIPLEETGLSGNMEINLEMTNIIYLLENVGMIKQDVQMAAKSTTTISAQGEKISFKMNFDSEGNLNLDSYDITGATAKESIIITNEQGNFLNANENPLADIAVKKFSKVYEMVKKLTKF